MTTASTAVVQARDASSWTADAGDYDAWFDKPWGRHAFSVEAATVLRAAGDLAGRRVLDAGCGTGPLLEIAGRGVPVWGAFQVLVIDKDRCV